MASQSKRSEVVRARRSQRRTSTRGSKAKQSTTRRQMPPMVSRNTMGTPRSAAQMRSKPERRRYDIALGATGSEVRLPAIGLPRLSWRLISFVLLIGFSYLFYFMWTSPQFTVTDEKVTVNGLHRVNREDLLDISGIVDKPVFLINTEDLEASLEKEVPALELAEVSIGMGGNVLINVVERIPVIVWNQQSIDQVWWVDMFGMRFKALGASDGLIHIVADVPPPTPPAQPVETEAEATEAAAEATSTADDSGLLMSPELVQGIMEIPAYMPAGAELIYDDIHGIGWQDPDHNWVVYFGKQLDQMPLRLKIYQAIVDYLSDKNNQPVLISVEYLHAPYYRMEP